MRRFLNITLFFASLIGLATATTAQAEERILLDIRSAGLDGFEPTAKDAAAFAAIRQIGARLIELPAEFDGDPEAVEAIDLGWDLLTSAMALRVVGTDEQPGFGVTLAVRPAGDQSPEKFAERMIDLAVEAGLEAEEHDDDTVSMMTPGGPVSFAVTDHKAGAAATFSLGAATAADLEVADYGLPAGATALASFRVDMRGVSQFLVPMMQAQEPETAQLLIGLGFLGEGAPTIEAAIGVLGKDMHAVSRTIDATTIMSAYGAGPDVVFHRDDFKMVPKDPTRVHAGIFSLENMIQMLEAALAAEGEQNPFEMIQKELGVDVRNDILTNLGPRWMFYQADTTGGGGLLSSVVIADIGDATTFATAHRRLVKKANEFGKAEADGYVRIRAWSIGTHKAYSFTTPGIPVPFEPSWAVVGERLVVAASPVSLQSALAQINKPKSSVLDTASFKEVILRRVPGKGVGQVSYIDAPRLARRGYGLTNLLLSGLANGVRSPKHPNRVPGPLMPAFDEFAEGIRPMGAVGYWEGDDFIQHMIADRSLVVSAAAGVGAFTDMQAVIIAPLMAGIMLPALGQARGKVQELKAMTQVRGIAQGVILYSSSNDDMGPETVQELIDNSLILPEMLVSPVGPAADGGPDIAIRPIAENSFDPTELIVIDRASYFGDPAEGVIVAFADNHVEVIDYGRFEALLNQPNNEGLRELWDLD